MFCFTVVIIKKYIRKTTKSNTGSLYYQVNTGQIGSPGIYSSKTIVLQKPGRLFYIFRRKPEVFLENF